MDRNNSNTFLAIALSLMVLLAWQYFYVSPKLEDERRQAEIAEQSDTATAPASNTEDIGVPQASTGDEAVTTTQSEPQPDIQLGRDQALASGPRLAIETERLQGSLNLKGARIDDLQLRKYRETVDPESPLINLLSPRGSGEAYFAEFGFAAAAAAGEVPGPQTVWNAAGDTALSADNPVQLVWQSPSGLSFQRTISVDENYMFTFSDTVTNNGANPVNLQAYGRIARFYKPATANIFVLHEGLIGVLGEEGLQEIDYDDIEDEGRNRFDTVPDGWLGITDKYWATALIPEGSFRPTFSFRDGQTPQYQADFLGEALPVAPGQSVTVTNRLFAGAKKSDMIDAYESDLGIRSFELMIDWGWFHFITKPLFHLLSWLQGMVGNFGVAILIATVIVKAVFLPLANMSYASMAKMKKVQPEMMEIRERYNEDKAKQQQEMMALYRREKINPAAGCWPILVQIPVFFALYKVLFVTIEMRHAPFFGWIQDLAAPDPTSIFNLFGLLPYDVPGILLIGVWPLLMGITMFLQMQMNPAPPDPTQAMIFKWMPIVFTFLLATFPAGLVIYWAWNNFLSIIQQAVIMKRHGTKIELWDNLKGMFGGKKDEPAN